MKFLKFWIFMVMLHGLAVGTGDGFSEESLTQLEERLKGVTGSTEAREMVEDAYAEGDLARLKIFLRHGNFSTWVADIYESSVPSTFKDKVTTLRLVNSWPTDRTEEGVSPARKVPQGYMMLPFADYMKKRLGRAIIDPDSDLALQEACSTRENRIAVARQFVEELVKHNLAKPGDFPTDLIGITTAASEPSSFSSPANSSTKITCSETPENRKWWWIVSMTAALIVVLSGFRFWQREKAKRR